MKHTIEFQPDNITVTVDKGENLLSAAAEAGVYIHAYCGGDGVCGKCKVHVDKGEVRTAKGNLKQEDWDKGYRLACLSFVESDLTVTIPEMTSKSGKILKRKPKTTRTISARALDTLIGTWEIDPPVSKIYLELDPPSMEDNISDMQRVMRGIKMMFPGDSREPSYDHPELIKHLPRALRESDWKITLLLLRGKNKGETFRIIDVEAGDTTARLYGLAVDIGTTTCSGVLVDLNTGKIIAEASGYNGQISYGEDVISRVVYAEQPGGLETMRMAVVGTINKVIDRTLAESRVDRNEITSITLAGNTVMTHLFVGMEPYNIRRSPYVPVTTLYPPIRATDLGLKLPSHAVALLYPSISSWVGGDIVAGVMGSGMYRTDKLTLFLDIGTNAEIVIGNREWLVCAACSAGPAFEGGGITCGMRAAAGAISDCRLHPESWQPMNTTLKKKPPRGICGSGLLNTVAEFFEQGVIDRRGKYIRNSGCDRIRPGRSGYEFVLARREESGSDHDIVLTEVDIENFIRAKGAIFAGVTTLLSEVGLQVADLDQVILAGAFGSFIDIDSAVAVGLLPERAADKVVYVGNGSLMGCRMSGLSNHIRQDVGDVVRKMTNFELSEVSSFRDEYVAALFLPHTDLSFFPSRDRKSDFSSGRQTPGACS